MAASYLLSFPTGGTDVSLCALGQGLNSDHGCHTISQESGVKLEELDTIQLKKYYHILLMRSIQEVIVC